MGYDGDSDNLVKEMKAHHKVWGSGPACYCEEKRRRRRNGGEDQTEIQQFVKKI